MRDLIGITYDAGSGGPELTAAEWRQIETSLFLRDSNDLVMGGVRGGTVSNTGSSVTIAPLTVVVQTLADRGVYRGAFPAGATELAKTITAAHATLARVDALDVKIFDHEADGGGLRGADIQLNAGTASASPSAPAFSGVGIRLGTFAVPASGGGSPVFTPNPNLVGYASAGGILDVATRPSNPRPGTVIYNRSTGALEVYHSSGWRNILTSVWTSWIPSWTASGGTNPNKNGGPEVGAYRICGGMVDAYWKFEFPASGYHVGVGSYAWTLPVNAHADMSVMPIGQLVLNDSSAALFYQRGCTIVGNVTSFAAYSDSGQRLSATNPVVPGATDTIAFRLRYRPAIEAP